MEPIKNIIKGEWISTDDGLAIAGQTYHYYYEEFDEIPERKQIGDYHYSMVEYKVFCDYNGRPIKRNRHKISRIEYCDPIESKYKKTLNRAIKENPKEYASFEKLLKEKNTLKSWTHIIYEFSDDEIQQAILDAEKIKESITEKFSFEDLLRFSSENHCELDLRKNIYCTHMYKGPKYLFLDLVYNYGDFVGLRILYHKLTYEIR